MLKKNIKFLMVQGLCDCGKSLKQHLRQGKHSLQDKGKFLNSNLKTTHYLAFNFFSVTTSPCHRPLITQELPPLPDQIQKVIVPQHKAKSWVPTRKFQRNSQDHANLCWEFHFYFVNINYSLNEYLTPKGQNYSKVLFPILCIWACKFV